MCRIEQTGDGTKSSFNAFCLLLPQFVLFSYFFIWFQVASERSRAFAHAAQLCIQIFLFFGNSLTIQWLFGITTIASVLHFELFEEMPHERQLKMLKYRAKYAKYNEHFPNKFQYNLFNSALVREHTHTQLWTQFVGASKKKKSKWFAVFAFSE